MNGEDFNPFKYMSISEGGLKLLKIIFDFQTLAAKFRDASLPDREKSATLLRKMAQCLGEIEDEMQSAKPRATIHVGSMRVYLDVFEGRFGPLIGFDKAQNIKNEMRLLFGEESDTDDGFLVKGFSELKEIEAKGGIDTKHVQAALATLILCKEQLEAYADVIEAG